MTWKTSNGKTQATSTQPQLEVLLQGLLNPVTLLDVIRHFIVFEASKHEDSKGIISIRTVKKMAAYHQYYAVNAAVLSTIRASGECGLPSAEVAVRQQGVTVKISLMRKKPEVNESGRVWHRVEIAFDGVLYREDCTGGTIQQW
jgi:type I restriction enzyme R subunit